MEHFSVKVTGAFEQDLAIAYGYYQTQAGPQSANRFLDEYDLTVERLSVMPSAAVKLAQTGYLWCPIGSFTAVFSIDDDNHIVYLLRLFYMSSNWKHRILEEGDIGQMG